MGEDGFLGAVQNKGACEGEGVSSKVPKRVIPSRVVQERLWGSKAVSSNEQDGKEVSKAVSSNEQDDKEVSNNEERERGNEQTEDEECASDATLDRRSRQQKERDERARNVEGEPSQVEREEAPEEEPSTLPEDEEDMQAEEEGRIAKGLRAPRTVSKEEREEHEKTHIPFRSWCRACVRGRKRKMAHQRKSEAEKEEERANGVPRVSMDYHFMSKEDEDAKRNPLLTMVNEKTGDKFTRAVGRKGISSEGDTDWIIKDMSDELKSWGHVGGVGGKLILKCDGEA